MTFNGRNVTLAEINKIYETHHKILNEDRPILSVAKCRPMIVVSKNIRYMGIFAGVPRGGDVKYNTCVHADCARSDPLAYGHGQFNTMAFSATGELLVSFISSFSSAW